MKHLIAAILLSSLIETAIAYTGSAACQSCHPSQHSLWQNSHHDLAMQLPTPDTVLGDFNNASFVYNGITTRFFRQGDQYKVRTDGEDGKLADFTVDYVFGVYPLQQYLLPLPGGRWQALSITWDARPAAEGGQRWYHLYPGESIDFKDPLHWTGPYQNWNTRCAECHSTHLEKNYNGVSRTFTTTFKEIDVGCEACHGPGERHLHLVSTNQLEGASNSGFPTALAQRGRWSFEPESAIARRDTALQSNAQIDSCGRCHSRRGTLGDYHYGADLLDTHRLSLPQDPLYYHDGQVRDEDYVYGSFIQSKMHRAGVVCSNCHEPHSLELRAEKNAVCAQCHKPAEYDNSLHHHHKPGSAGAECANCHMPETTYMGIDPRRDHSMRIPRPDLSVVMGTPNACTQCHRDQKPSWALESLREWNIHFRDTGSHPARAFMQADQGDSRALPTLVQLAGDNNAAMVWRATAMEALGEFGGRDALMSATSILYTDDPLLRTSTVRSLQFLPLHQRYQLLQPLIDDEITAVRMEVAVSLAGVPLDQITEQQAEQLRQLFKQYTTIQKQHADMPSVQLQLGIFYTARGDSPSAEAAYREAIYLNPQLIPALLNLADLLRSQARENEARKILLQALAIAPQQGATLHALGLLETRSANPELALDYLGRAAALETMGTRHRFVYAIALHDLGQPQNAVNALLALLRQTPRNEEALLALTNYSAELGQADKAQRYAGKLLEIAPKNTSYQTLYKQLSTN